MEYVNIRVAIDENGNDIKSDGKVFIHPNDIAFTYPDAVKRDYLQNGGVVIDGKMDLLLFELSLAKIGKVANVPTPSQKIGEISGSLAGLTPHERTVLMELSGIGKNVKVVEKSTIQNIKTPDFIIDGVKTELKELRNTNINTGITRIQDAFKQNTEAMILDARGTNLTIKQAQEIINRAIGSYPNKKLPGKVEIWTKYGLVKG